MSIIKRVRLGINGFGRIGRIATRIAIERGDVDIVAINSRADSLSHAHLLAFDSNYGIFPHQVRAQGRHLIIDKAYIRVFREPDPALIPWKNMEVDVVLEASGMFRSRELAGRHLIAGAKRVIITAPAKDDMLTICLGVNEKQVDFKRERVISNASCTTNCLAVVCKVLDDAFAIVCGSMTTTHAYTDSQNLVDNSHNKDLRLARAAALSMIPAATGASYALALVIPNLSGKIIATSIRVPVSIVSLVDLSVIVRKKPTKAAVNSAFLKQAKSKLRGILETTSQPLVSSDFRGNPHSAIVDLNLTQTLDNLVNVKAWYDNEWGYASRLIDLSKIVSESI